ncbi:hypothetical protein PV04_00181 [Phialophora macrospora]|uniref:Uncharacterized protein n=1 Tax=Phialophora macrospora TaxID=1851006 RepID=A0A0D2FZQ4_9EURO|nr:hypothetical protein PV04_00181 [Phialophora macrospora]
MGRQAHLARLALGRSPFDAPLQDENGDLILGPNVQHDTGRNYIQDFDSRGHPRNIRSEISRRRLLRAQNEALYTVGVVVKKAKANRSRWQAMDDKQKFRLVVEENTAGAYLGLSESILQKLSSHWILNLRQRVLTYKSYLRLPVPQMMLSEWNTVGTGAFLFAGIFPATIARTSQYIRSALLQDDAFSRSPDRQTSLLQRSDVASTISYASLQILWFAIEYSFHAYAVLQALYILPPGFRPSFLTMIPFTDVDSPGYDRVQNPNQSWFSLATDLAMHMRNPFAMAMMRDQISGILFPKLYVWMRELLVKPNRPDAVSLQSASVQLHIVPGKITSPTARRLALGEGKVKGLLGRWLSNLLWFSLSILHTQRVPMAIELSPEIEAELIGRSAMHYHVLVRQDRDNGITRAPRTLRVMAIRAAFHDFNLDPDSSMVDIFELADEMSLSGSSRASTSTPEPQDLPSPEDVMAGASNMGQSAIENETEMPTGTGETQDVSLATNEVAGGDDHDRAASLELLGRSLPASEDVRDSVLNTATGAEPLAAERVSTDRTSPDEPDYISMVWGADVAAIFEDDTEPEAAVAQEPAFDPAVPLETLLQPAPAHVYHSPDIRPASPGQLSGAQLLLPPSPSTPVSTLDDQGPDPPASQPTTPPSPIPGISRAHSLHEIAGMWLARRPTVSDQHVPTFRDEVNRRRLEPDVQSQQDTNFDTYRVTILSNHAAEAFAYHATSLVESIILLPFDAIFTRSLARNFLTRHPNWESAHTAPLMGEIWPLGLRAQMQNLTVTQEMQFWGNFLITMGMQGLMNFAIWAVGTRITLKLGERFGWGNI